MSITSEQVADLERGDVVELTSQHWGGAALRGPLVYDSYAAALLLRSPGDQEQYVIRGRDGEAVDADVRTLTVVSRVPRPLYVNHPRTTQAVGDVVRSADDDRSVTVWLFTGGGYVSNLGSYAGPPMPDRLRLLVDGETGQVVTS